MEQTYEKPIDYMLWGIFNVLETHGGAEAKKYQLTLEAVDLANGRIMNKEYAEVRKRYR